MKWMKITKRRYVKYFFIVVAVLAVVRVVGDIVSDDTEESPQEEAFSEEVAASPDEDVAVIDGSDMADVAVAEEEPLPEEPSAAVEEQPQPVEETAPEQTRRKYHRIRSVPSYSRCFPDLQDVQLQAARKWGVSPVADRDDAERRMGELVFIGANPYYEVDKLTRSIPYLVPRAAVLLNDIGKAFLDSLQVKGLPLHKIVVTSVLRTKGDVKRLKRGNVNATDNSCHLYGTTIDITYRRFKAVSTPADSLTSTVGTDRLKWVLSEVLRDFREDGRCYIKYEVKQACFHMTVR